MTTLTQTSLFSKKAFLWVNIAIATIIGLIISFNVLSSLFKKIFPPQPEPALVAFQKLPQINFSALNASPAVTYNIETISGDLPNFPPYAKVFTVSQNTPSFGDLERAKTKVSRINFPKEPFEITGTVAKFSDPNFPDRILTIETTTGNLTLESNYLQNPLIITTRPESLELAIEKARALLENFDVSQNEFPNDKIQTKTYKIEDGTVVETPSLAGSNLVKVIFQRNDLDKIPIIYERDQNPKVWALVSKDQVVAATLSSAKIKKHSFSTYPLKSPQAAFSELKEAKGYLNKGYGESIFPIREVSLGYVETENPQEFLEPFYFFKSDNGLIAFVSAIDNAWIIE